jgi:hypothetical protein
MKTILFAILCALAPADVETARRAVIAWLECEDCVSGELAAVVHYGDTVVPMLRAAILGGASPATKAVLRLDLEERYDELVAREAKPPYAKVGSTKEAFVARNLESLDAQYKIQAAMALAAIGTPSAKKAMQDGLASASRPDIREAIRSQLKKAAGRKHR